MGNELILQMTAQGLLHSVSCQGAGLALLDLETGEPVYLDGLAGKLYGEFTDALLDAMGNNAPADLALPVNFFIDRNELIVAVPSGTSDWPDYYLTTMVEF